jgi:hypothetical protein
MDTVVRLITPSQDVQTTGHASADVDESELDIGLTVGWPLDRATFIKRLDDLRVIRNNVMHFNPEPLPANTVGRLRYILKPLRDYGAMITP